MSELLSNRELRIAALLKQRAPAMLDDLQRYVAIPTGWNHSAGLDELRSVVSSRLEALGARLELVAGEPKPDWLYDPTAGANSPGAIPPTLVASQQRPTAATRILIASHLDTVFNPADDFRELVVAADGKRATGPGCVDMKGGIVAALHALETLEEVGVNVSWTYLFNSDEETGSHHSSSALRAQASLHDVGLATEPALAGGELAIARMGSGQFRIDARGVSAHVGRAFHEGVNAVHALARAIAAVDDIAKGSPPHIVSVGAVQGGSAINIVPDHAVAWGNARFQSVEEADDVGARLDALASAHADGATIEVRRSFSRPPKPEIPATRALAELAQRVADDLGQALPFATTGGVCDGNNLQAEGLPTIDTLGVRGGGLHTTSEWIDLPSLAQRATLLAILLARLTDQPRAGR